jgi:hypothetical protein
MWKKEDKFEVLTRNLPGRITQDNWSLDQNFNPGPTEK